MLAEAAISIGPTSACMQHPTVCAPILPGHGCLAHQLHGAASPPHGAAVSMAGLGSIDDNLQGVRVLTTIASEDYGRDSGLCPWMLTMQGIPVIQPRCFVTPAIKYRMLPRDSTTVSSCLGEDVSIRRYAMGSSLFDHNLKARLA